MRNKKFSELLLEIKEVGGKEIRENGLTFFELTDPVSFLHWCTQNGYLLHGSPRFLSEISPKQSHDDYREAGSQTAVYMADHPEPSMFMCLAGGTGSSYRVYRNKQGKVIDSSFKVRNLSNIRDFGFIYVIDNQESSDILDGDHVAYHSVKPVLAIKFRKSDFPFEIKEGLDQ